MHFVIISSIKLPVLKNCIKYIKQKILVIQWEIDRNTTAVEDLKYLSQHPRLKVVN